MCMVEALPSLAFSARRSSPFVACLLAYLVAGARRIRQTLDWPPPSPPPSGLSARQSKLHMYEHDGARRSTVSLSQRAGFTFTFVSGEGEF